jgi:SAM-dependent methyltransferase
MASEKRFGYQWERYGQLLPQYQGQFRNWTNLTSEEVKGKDVLDAGCGMGRNSYWPLVWGAKSLVAFDNDERSLTAAKRTLADFPNATIERHDISELAWESRFDLVLCIGVLHHLRRPHRALENLVRSLRPGGRLIVWVYSYEGSEWIVRYVNPIRIHVTSRMPLPLVHALAYVLALPLFGVVKIGFAPTQYLRQLAGFSLRHVANIVFDQLIPEVANYWRREEVEALIVSLPLRNLQISRPRNEMGWVLSASKT